MIAPTTPTAFMCKKNVKIVIKIDILEKGEDYFKKNRLL